MCSCGRRSWFLWVRRVGGVVGQPQRKLEEARDVIHETERDEHAGELREFRTVLQVDASR